MHNIHIHSSSSSSRRSSLGVVEPRVQALSSHSSSLLQHQQHSLSSNPSALTQSGLPNQNLTSPTTNNSINSQNSNSNFNNLPTSPLLARSPIINSRPSRRQSLDRFIPQRQSDTETEVAKFMLHHESPKSERAESVFSSPTRRLVSSKQESATQRKDIKDTTPSHEEYKAFLGARLFGPTPNQEPRTTTDLMDVVDGPAPLFPQKRVLAFSDFESPTKFRSNPSSPMRVTSPSSGLLKSPPAAPAKPLRDIPKDPYLTLDAPDLEDDYYLNLLDWSADNIIALALGRSVYLWNAETSKTQSLMTLSDPSSLVTSVAFVKSDRGSPASESLATCPLVAIGTTEAQVQVWDLERNKKLRTLTGHTNRVGSLDWSPVGQSVISSGSRDGLILSHDIRVPKHAIANLQNHRQEVCGLKWSRDGSSLASGGNDNLLNVWDAHTQSCRFSFDHHVAAVKALAWCPWQTNLLASGGGTADRTIRFWNTHTGACINTLDTQSQVCALQWSKNYRELVSSHGYSKTALIVWKYPKMKKITELKGHTSRVLHMVSSPDGSTVASCAKDETLRLWKIWDVQKQARSSSSIFAQPTYLR